MSSDPFSVGETAAPAWAPSEASRGWMLLGCVAVLVDAGLSTAGMGAGDPYTAPAAGSFLREVSAARPSLRIAWTSTAPNGAPVDDECRRVLADTVRRCAELGHRVQEADPVVDGAVMVPAFVTIAAANTLVNLGGHPAGKAPRADEVEKVTWAMAGLGQTVTAADYVRATQTAHRLGRQMAAFHADYDLLLTPALGTLPPKLGWLDMMMDDVHEYWRRVFAFSPFTVWFNLTGQPAMALPMGRSREGLPVCVQLVGRFGDEATIFSLAGQLEAARG